jgi:magnesium chelatase subunit I
LRHRRREMPQQPAHSPAAEPQGGQGSTTQQGQGAWGEMPPQATATGARREVPNWAKKP